MNILYISDSVVPSRTANSLHVMKMCNAFVNLGHQVVLVTDDNPGDIETGITDVFSFYGLENRFKIISLNRDFTNKDYNLLHNLKMFWIRLRYGVRENLLLSVHLKKIINKYSPDVIFGRSLSLCEMAAVSFHRNVYYENHQPYRNDNNIIALKNIIANKRLAGFIAVTSQVKSVYEGYGVDKDKIIILPDGADVVKTDNRVLLNGNAPLNAGYVGHLYDGKGLEVIRDIAPRLTGEVNFHIIGGLQSDIDRWREQITSPNVFFYGFIPQTELSAYINSLDICLLPNQKNVFSYAKDGKGANIGEYTSPLKMFEYMAHKKPIIASDLPVLREILNENNAILVDPENPEEWIEAIAKLRDKDLRERLAERAYSDFINNYTWLKRAEKLCSFFTVGNFNIKKEMS